MISIYPLYPVHKMGKFTHFVYGTFWVSFDSQLPQPKKGERIVTSRAEKNLH